MAEESGKGLLDDMISRLGALLVQLVSNPIFAGIGIGSPFLTGYILGWTILGDHWENYTRWQRFTLSSAVGGGLAGVTATITAGLSIVVKSLTGNELVITMLGLLLISFVGGLRILLLKRQELKVS